jgi:protein TonB
VKVVRGIGSGCDEIAIKALKQMTLTAALGTDGQVADYAGLRYEYVFEPPS